MKKWCNVKLYKQGKEYNYDLPLTDMAIILVDCWEKIIIENHRNKITLMLDKMRSLGIPVIHASYVYESGIEINEMDIVLHDRYCSIKDMPKYLFYAGYEIDKCLLGREVGIPYAKYENKIPILIKDLTESINEYSDISSHLMKIAAIHIIEHCYGFTTTFEDVMNALNHVVTTTTKRTVIEMGKVLVR